MSLFVYLKAQLPIVDVISQFVNIKPAGNYWKGPCPFHAEKDASFTVSPDKQIFYCFGCHASGDVISFIAKVENLTQIEAAQHLVERFNVQVPQNLQNIHAPTTEEKNAKDLYFRLCKAFALWAHQQLLNNKVAYNYLLSRHITDESIKTFQVGYFPGGMTNISMLSKDLAAQGFMVKDMLDAGILQEGRSMLYSPFEERIIFPIKDTMGKYCGFGGRIFKPGDERPKYYNSKEADGFEKGKLLYWLDMAKKSLQEHNFAFLVEGYMDCLMMVQHGHLNTIATLGTACTLDHLKMIARYINTLFVLYDGDQAGQKAMLRLTEMCWEVNLEVKVITLPPGQDPASFLSQGGDFAQLLGQAVDIITFFINSTGSNFALKPLAQKVAAAEKITALIAQLSSNFKQDILLHHTATVTQMPFASLKELMQRKPRPQPNASAFHAEKIPPAENSVKIEDPTQPHEIFLLEEKVFSAIINSLKASTIIQIPDEIRPYFSKSMQEALQKLDSFIMQHHGNEKAVSAFFDTLDPEQKDWAMRVSMHHDGAACEQVIDRLLLRFCKHYWQCIVKDVKEELIKAKQENNSQKVNEVLERFSDLKQGVLRRGLIR